MSSPAKTTSGARRSRGGAGPAGEASGHADTETPARRSGFFAASQQGPERPHERQGYATALDGTPLFYQLVGPLDAEAVPVILSDGIGCDGYVWKYLRPQLGEARPVVHWHYRGHGKTPMPRDADRVSVADCADDLVAVLDAAEAHTEGAHRFDKVVLAGHSMGVQVCLEALRRHGRRVAGLMLLCGSYGTPLRTFKNSRVLEDALPAIRLGIHALPRAVTAFFKTALPTQLAYRIATLTEVNGQLVRPEDFMPYLEHMAQVDPRLFIDMLAAAGRHTARELLPKVSVPTLIIAGDQDGFTPLSLSEEMHRAIPGSRLHVVRGGSHTAPIERPREVARVVGEFLDGLA